MCEFDLRLCSCLSLVRDLGKGCKPLSTLYCLTMYLPVGLPAFSISCTNFYLSPRHFNGIFIVGNVYQHPPLACHSECVNYTSLRHHTLEKLNLSLIIKD